VQLPDFSQGQTKDFLVNSNTKYLAMHSVKNSIKNSTSSQTIVLRSYGYMCPNLFIFQNLVLVLEMAIFKRFFGENSQGNERVINVMRGEYNNFFIFTHEKKFRF